MMKKKALLVNDSRFESLIMKDMLNDLGYDVELADEFDAIYEVEKFEPNIIIVNYIMKKTKGDSLIKIIKNNMPSSKCFLSSSNIINEDNISNEVDGVLHIPLTKSRLSECLDKIVERKKTTENSNINYCPYCANSLVDFNNLIVYCPFCGKSLK